MRPQRRQIGGIRGDRIIRRLGNSFTHSQCIAEIIKNSNDDYATNDLPPNARMILIMVVCGETHDRLLMLDVGNSMTPLELDRWATWGEESYHRAGEGEQGIGGKASMRQLADESSSLTAFKNNFMTTAGFYKDPETGELGEMVEVEWDYDQEQVVDRLYRCNRCIE